MKHGPDKVIIFIPTFGFYRIRKSELALFQDGIELAAEAADPSPILNQLAYRAAASDTEVSVGSLMEEFPDRAPSLNKEIQLEDGDKVVRFGLDGSRQDEIIKEPRVISNADEGIGGRPQEDPSEDVRAGRGDQAFQDSTPQGVPQELGGARQEQPQQQPVQQGVNGDVSPEEAELIRQAKEVTPERRAEIIQGVQARVAALGQANANERRGGFTLGKLGNAVVGIDKALGSIVNRVVGVGQPSVLEDISKAGSAEVRKIIGDDVRPDEIAAQRRLAGIEGLIFSQAVQDGFLKPTAAIIDFAARLVGGLDIEQFDEFEAALDRADDFVASRLTETISQAEQIALHIGFSERQIASMQTGGSIFGFLIPISGSLKTASILTRFKGGLGLRFMIRDTVAGAIYGGVLAEEGELNERFRGALREGGIFGGFSALMGLTPWIRVYRFKRQLTRVGFSRAEAKAIHNFLKDGKAVIPDGEGAIGAKQFMEMLAEEQIISRSPAAQVVLTRNADIDAMVTGLRDIASDRTGHVILNNVRDREEFTTQLKKLFPGVKLTVAKSVDGGGFTFVASFGERGLNNVQRGQLAKHGFFNGQRITHGGVEYEIAGVTSKGKIIRKTLDGKKIPGGVNPENVSFYGSARNLEVAEDALFRDFSSWLESRINQISEASGSGLTREEILSQLAKGEFNAVRLSSRVTVGDHILIPEEAGLDAAQNIVTQTGQKGLRRKINLESIPVENLGLTPEQLQAAQQEGKAFFQVLRGDEPTMIIEVTQIGEKGALITARGGETLENLPRGTAKIIGERLNELIPGIERVEVAGIKNTVFETNASNILRGAEDIVILPPEPLVGFSDAVEVYLKEKGIIGSDVEVFKEFAAQRMRRLLFETLPETEQTLVTNLRNSYAENLNRARTDLKYKASTQGYTLEQANGVHKLTDVNSGAEFFFESEKGLKEALKVARTDRNLTEYSSSLPDDFATIGSPETPGIDLAGDLLDVPTESFARNLLKDVPDTRFFNNIRDSTLKFEEATGIPLHSKFFEPLFADMTRARNEIAITLPRLQSQWKVLSKTQRIQIADYWQAIEGKGLTAAEKLTAARTFGLNDKQIKVAGEMRKVWNDAFERTGMPRDMFIDEYYARIRPYMEANNTISRQGVYNGTPPAGMDPWFENWRLGELADIEKDPMVVMMKWFKADSMNRNVKESWDKVTALVGFGQRGAKGSLKPFRFNQLDPAQQARVSKFYEGINLKLDPSGSVIPDFYADQLSQVLLNMRGNRSAALSTSAGVFRRIFRGMGVEVSDPVLSQLFADMQSTMFGALVATPRAVARNMVTQALFFDYGRFGAEALGKAMNVSRQFEFYEKAVQDGAVRFTEGGLVGFDVAFEQILVSGSKALDVTQPWGHATAAATRLLLRGGKLSRGAARKFLIPYSSVDELNRVRSYWTARFSAEKHLPAFKAGKISEKEFLERTTIGFSPSVKKTFIERLKVSDDRGLGYLGKTAADENHFIYALSTQPLALQTGWGRFLGMFASWPLWAKEMYTFRLGNMSWRQRILFAGRNSIAAGSIGVVGLELGYNLWSWIAPTSMFTFGGGPGVEMLDGMRDLIRSPMDRKANAVQKLTRLFGKIAFPGMQTLRDVNRVLEDTSDPMEMAFGMVLGRPTDRGIEIDFSKLIDDADREAVAGKQPAPTLQSGIDDLPTKGLVRTGRASILQDLQGTAQPTDRLPVAQP